MCPQGRAQWRHLANMIKLVLPSAHPSPQPKRQIDRFGRFCTAHGRQCVYFTMGTLSPQFLPFCGDREPHVFHDSLSQTEPTVQLNCITLGSAIFAQVIAECPYTLRWAPLSSKIAHSHWESGPRCKTQFLGLIRAQRPNDISIGSAVFAQMTAEYPYTLQWDAPFPSKLPLPMGIWTPI